MAIPQPRPPTALLRRCPRKVSSKFGEGGGEHATNKAVAMPAFCPDSAKPRKASEKQRKAKAVGHLASLYFVTSVRLKQVSSST